MENTLLLLLAYLLGSIPFSFLIGEMVKGEDIRKYGSGNLGATNAFRVFGKIIGSTVLILDALKSGIIVFLMMNTSLFSSMTLISPLYFGLAAVIGHIFPVWFKFKGGKGVASSFGLLLAYDWRIALFMFIIFMVFEVTTRYVSVSSVSSALITWFVILIRFIFWKAPGDDYSLLIVTTIVVGLIVYRHKANYKRLKNGTESKVKWLNFLDKK